MKQSLKEFYYKILDLITNKKGKTITVNGFTVKMPLRYYKYYQDGYEKENFDFYRQSIKNGDVVIDIGGHLGLNAVAFSQLAPNGKVYVFEPAPNTFKIIHHTIALNKINNIEVFPQAISDSLGKTHFFINDSPIADNANSLIEHRHDKKLLKIEVDLTSIDEFIQQQKLTKVNFIKVDAEGAELSVLKGAEYCMANFKPKMSIGLHPHPIQLRGDSLEQIYEILKKHNYTISLNDKEMTKDDFCTQTDLFDVQVF
jgi:FkbM family methyltransferase